MDIAVSEAAERLGVDASRVRKLLRSGSLLGRQAGKIWLVSSEDVARMASHHAPPGRPLAPGRAWGLLDLLDGGSAPRLSPVARSQVRQLLRDLNGASADRWRAALRARSAVLRCNAHPAAVKRFLGKNQNQALRAGPQEAARRGVDLIAMEALPEIYVPEESWPALALSLRVAAGAYEPDLLVRLPRAGWPFQGKGEVSLAALAADLLESAEPRAISGGASMLNKLSEQAVRPQR
jgi:excisionase family DNA binding protein